MTLSGIDVDNLLLHLVSKVPSVYGRSKFRNIAYLLNNVGDPGAGIFPYKFNSYFLNVRDKDFDNAVCNLAIPGYLDVTSIKTSETTHTHKIEISKKGRLHLKAMNISEKLKELLEKDTLKEIEDAFIKYNEMSTDELGRMVETQYRFVLAPEAASYGNE